MQCPENSQTTLLRHLHTALHTGCTWDQIQPAVSGHDNILHDASPRHHIGKRALRVGTYHNADVGKVGIAIQQKHLLALLGQGNGQVQRHRGLANTALSTRNGNGSGLARFLRWVLALCLLGDFHEKQPGRLNLSL